MPNKRTALVLGSANRLDVIVPSDAEGRMPFIIRKISNYGTKHPVIARLKVQTHELLQWADLPKDKLGEVATIYFDMADRLIKCHEAFERLSAALHAAMGEISPTSDSRVLNGPHVIGLKAESETFLYESKNLLRDLVGVVGVFFGVTLDEASAFCNIKGKGDGKLVKWATARFGAADPFTTMLISEQRWIEELIRKRNAAEHPGKRSGTLHIENFQPLSNGQFLAPSWHRDRNPSTGIFDDLEAYLSNLLTLAEDMLVSCIHHKTRHKILQFVEIPEQDRMLECPMRITVTLNHAAMSPPRSSSD